MARPDLWVTRGRLAAARLQARSGLHVLLPLDVAEVTRHREPVVRATKDFAAAWRAAILDRLPPGHAHRVLLNQLISEASATYRAPGKREPLQAMWGATPIPTAEDCWAAYAGGFEVTWYNDQEHPVVSFLTLTSTADA